MPPKDPITPPQHMTLTGAPDSFESPESKLVARASYDAENQIASITLKAGGIEKTYLYGGFRVQDWVEFEQAQSRGSYFTRHIRPFYTGRLKE